VSQDGQDFNGMQSSAESAGFSKMENPNDSTLQCDASDNVSHYEPCDVDFLEIKSVADKKAIAAVKCENPAADDTSLTDEHLTLLDGDDLLIQTIADFHHDGTYDPNKMKEAVVALYGATSPACAKSTHRKIEWLPVKNTSKEDSAKTWDNNKPAPDQKVLAKSTRGRVGGFLERFWLFGLSDTAIYRAKISSCGLRDGAVPNIALTGRVEVQPDVKYELSLAIPSFYKMKRERKGEYDFKGDEYSTERTSSSSTNFGRDTGSETHKSQWNEGKGFSFDTEEISTRSGGGPTETYSSSEGRKNYTEYVAETETVTTHGWVMDNVLTSKDSTEEEVSLEEELKAGTNITLKRNGREIDIVKSVENIIKIAQNVQRAWDNFEQAVPKIGWQASLEIEIFTGTFTGEWGVRAKREATHPRIWETERYFAFNIDIRVFYLKADIGFGFEFIVENWFSSNPLLEIIVKITGGITVEVPLKTAIQWDKKDTLKSTLGVKPVANLKGIARASALGYAFEASCTIEAGIEFTGIFECDFDFSPTCNAKLEWVPLTVTTRLEAPRKRPRTHVWTWPEEKLEPIWEGVAFGDPGTPAPP